MAEGFDAPTDPAAPSAPAAAAPAPAAPAVRPAHESPLWPREVDWHADLPQRPLPTLFDDAVARYGDRPACDFLDRKFSYAEIGRLSDRFAKGLQ
ncbi:MAG: hypothetical protein GVY28_13965, partial [Alphaproteobacteria bacterium]|nr:hypothetical protein [Alphaproteobacteria bacterium]